MRIVRGLALLCLGWAVGLLPVRVVYAERIEDVPPPVDGTITDLLDVITAAHAVQIQEVASGLRQRTGAELIVVVIHSTEGRAPRAYATELFNTWSLGDAVRNDGIMVFAALDDRRAEIILGDGLDTPEHTRRVQRVMRQAIVPAFRRQDPSAAMMLGARGCATAVEELANGDPAGTGTAPESALGVLQRSSAGEPPEAQPTEVVSPASAAHTRRRTRSRRPRRDPGARERLSPSERPLGFLPRPSDHLPDWWPWAALGLAAFGGFIGWRAWRRHRPRFCPDCDVRLIHLPESEEDAHLEPFQRTEERVESVDYDVFACRQCDYAETLRTKRWFSGYNQCRKCPARTASSQSRTVQRATQYSTGLVEVTERCAHCGFYEVYERTTPKLDPPDSGGGSYSSSSFGSSTSSGSSSFSSGGGHSSGGGASGSW